MQDLLKLRHYSEKTGEAYTKWVSQFISTYPDEEKNNAQNINKILTKLAVQKKVSASTQNQALAVKFMYGTGIRLNEVLSLRILDIDFGQNEIIIRHGKGDKDRHVMLPQKLMGE